MDVRARIALARNSVEGRCKFCPKCEAPWPVDVTVPNECGHCNTFIPEVKIGNYR